MDLVMPGMGVLIHQLSGRSQEHVDELKNSFGKTIKTIELKDDKCIISFVDYPTIKLYDDGQSCCESRYMVCDDKLNEFDGTKLIEIKLENAPNIEDEYDSHEVQFLRLVTDRGIVTFSNHNEHNGFYGGFWIEWELTKI